MAVADCPFLSAGRGLEPTLLVVGAEAVRAPVALVAVHAAVAQLVRDGLRAPAQVLGDPVHRPFEFGEEPETLTVRQFHVCHFHLPLFRLTVVGRRAPARAPSSEGQQYNRTAQSSESKLGSPPRGGEREESSFPRQQPIFTGGKLPLKPSLLLEAAMSIGSDPCRIAALCALGKMI